MTWRLPGDLPNPVIEPRFPTLQVDSLPCEPPGKPQGHIQKTACWHEGAPKGGLATGAHRSGPQHKLSFPLPSLGQHVPPTSPSPRPQTQRCRDTVSFRAMQIAISYKHKYRKHFHSYANYHFSKRQEPFSYIPSSQVYGYKF